MVISFTLARLRSIPNFSGIPSFGDASVKINKGDPSSGSSSIAVNMPSNANSGQSPPPLAVRLPMLFINESTSSLFLCMVPPCSIKTIMMTVAMVLLRRLW